MRENTDQKKLRIWTPFTQCVHFKIALFILEHGDAYPRLEVNFSNSYSKTFKKTSSKANIFLKSSNL